jgi:Tfp pilus assembly protein FimT
LSQVAEIQKQVASSLDEARQEAVLQKTSVTYRYDDTNKIIVTFNGKYGALGDVRNRVIDLSGFGLEKSNVVYGYPDGVSESALTDTTNITKLTENSVEITFQPDGSVIDEANNPQNKALFFYYRKYPQNTAFAVSVLGNDGRVKLWNYSENIKDYVEKK